jgi:diadenosine tetraphosphate (Ap4A) HIT family hydrolase
MVLMQPATCDFCVEFKKADAAGAEDLIYPRSLPTRLLLGNQAVNVFPCLGSIELGHLLIASVGHYTSFLQLPPADYKSYGEAVRAVQHALRTRFARTPTYFEHGDPTGVCELQGPCVSHAHLHVAPSGQAMLTRLHSTQRYLRSVPLLTPNADIREPYLMCTDEHLTAHYFSAADTPRQYLRQLYAESVGNPDGWNWAVVLDVSKTSAEAELLRPFFQQARE